MSDELHNLREENKRLLDLVNNQGHGLFVADIELKKCKQQLAEATDTLSFLQREYGEADTSTLTHDAIQLKLRLVERERHSLEAELTSTKAALIDAALIHAKLIEERDKLISERRQLRARVVECLPWVGFAPYPGTPEFKEMLAIRKNAEDTLEEVKPWNP